MAIRGPGGQSEHATLKPQLEQMSSHRTSCISFPQTGQTFVSIDMVMGEVESFEHISKSTQVVVRNRQNVKTTVAAATEYHGSEQSSLKPQLGHTYCQVHFHLPAANQTGHSGRKRHPLT